MAAEEVFEGGFAIKSGAGRDCVDDADPLDDVDDDDDAIKPEVV